MSNTTNPHVYSAIRAVMADLSIEGIAKTGRNQQQGYNFRGIDAVYNALSPILAKNGLLMLPRILSRDVAERQTKSGGALFYVTVEAEFDLVSAEDGSVHTIRTFGEAMDSADKATNKAMSAAYKYAAMQAFAIPTEGDNDADATTHEVAPAPKQLVKVTREVEKELRGEIEACSTVAELKLLWNSPKFKAEFDKMKKVYQDGLIADFDHQIKLLTDRPANHGAGHVPPDFDNIPH